MQVGSLQSHINICEVCVLCREGRVGLPFAAEPEPVHIVVYKREAENSLAYLFNTHFAEAVHVL